MSKKKVVIGIVICFVLLIVLNSLINVEEEDPTAGSIDGTTLEGQLLLSGAVIFSEEYVGDIETTEIRQKIQELVKVDIPELYENIKKHDENEIKKYYKEKEVELKNKFGIQSEDEFVNFANKVKQSNIDLNSWREIKVNKESFIDRSEMANYAYVEFDVIFEKEQKMTFSLYIANRKIANPQYIFGIIQ